MKDFNQIRVDISSGKLDYNLIKIRKNSNRYNVQDNNP